MIISGPFIILEKRPYKEAGLLLRGVSPDYGRVSFILFGGQSLSKSAPQADIFREVEVEFEDDGTGKELFTARKMETLLDFSALAENPRNYRMAGKIGAFLLNNMPPGDVQLHSYEALRSVLSNLAGLDNGHPDWSLIQCSVVLKSAFLYENGMLPEAVSPEQNEFLENLVASGVDNSPLPECPDNYWDKLNNWLNELIAFHQLKK
ncbi:MAG: recombination protein O N-terminal domain-containing protein [Lentisphaeria bacterium]|nr:recombination protein O N-terminal domain-containing protein [Lentisphaeria bacterium]